ncbi:MAG: marine proteobacterial sortase target protein [Cognaticolwellia sp.]
MYIPTKKLILIDDQKPYFYQQQRKKNRSKYVKCLAVFMLLALFVILSATMVPLAQASTQENARNNSLLPTENRLIHGPQLIFSHPGEQERAALPVDMSANIEINGLVAYAEITQVFINPYNSTLEGKYQFPLPENSAVKYLKVKVADKEIVGSIMEKSAAKAVYQQAKKQGEKASLVQQQRPNLFTNNIANIPAQSKVVVTIEFMMPISFNQDTLSLTLPLAMTARYHPHTYQKSPADQGTKFIAPLSNTLAKSQAAITIVLNAGAPITAIHSTSHKIASKTLADAPWSSLITLSDKQAIADRDFNLSWQLQPREQPHVSSFSEKVADEYFTLLTFFPPQVTQASTLARDIIFIIDTSGSMQGASMAQAKASLQQAILQLNHKDSFNIIAFDNSVDLLFPATHMASPTNIGQAKQFIQGLRADGGTEMFRPLSQALVMSKTAQQTPKAIRQVVFITDGAVANEFELMQLLEGAQGNFRLFTVGIGAAPNGYFMKKAAQFGRGSYVFIQNSADVQSKMSQLMTKINHPTISNIAIMVDNQMHQQVDIYPKRIADLYLGEPMQVAIKSTQPLTSVQVMGETASASWHQQLIIDDSQLSSGISTLWARQKIADLLDSLVVGADKEKVKAEVIATSINHQTLSPYTSFIAVEKQPELMPLSAKNRPSKINNTLDTLAKAHENLMVAMPKTALGWHQQLLIGLLLMLLAPLSFRIWPKQHG